MGISFSTLREEFKKHIKPFVREVSKYDTHSMKSGEASNPGCREIAGDLLGIHAGWRCESTKHKYIKGKVRKTFSKLRKRFPRNSKIIAVLSSFLLKCDKSTLKLHLS